MVRSLFFTTFFQTKILVTNCYSPIRPTSRLLFTREFRENTNRKVIVICLIYNHMEHGRGLLFICVFRLLLINDPLSLCFSKCGVFIIFYINFYRFFKNICIFQKKLKRNRPTTACSGPQYEYIILDNNALILWNFV